MSFNQEIYRAGDFAYIEPTERGMEYSVVLIERLWTNAEGQQMLYGNLFYRPSETYHVASRKFLDKELFKSDAHVAIPLAKVAGRCCVLSVKDYFRMQPEGFLEKDVYVCESRYSTKARAFVELGAYEEPTCDAYPLALSLRAADALKKLPHLRRGGSGGSAGSAGRCGTLHKLDAFLTSAEQGTYDPDAFTQAVEALRADGLLYDAAVLLTRQRQEGHCNPALITAARTFGRTPALGPSLRADALSVAVNCTSASLNDAAIDDLLALHAETRLLPDLSRNLRIVLAIADLALQAKRWDLLARLTAEPDFVEQWMRVSPQAATLALLLTQIAATLTPQSTAPTASAAGTSSYDLLCQTFPPGDRAALCADIAALRAPSGRAPSGHTPDPRQRRAEDALRRLLEQTTGKSP